MPKFSQADVESVQQKLQAFANGLPKQEQNVMDWVLSRTSTDLSDSELEDVSGGRGEYQEAEDSVSVSVGWSKS